VVVTKSLKKNGSQHESLPTELLQKVTKGTIYRYLVKKLGAQTFVLRKVPKITEKQRGDYFNFCHDQRMKKLLIGQRLFSGMNVPLSSRQT
jgi:hypothetical protein